MPTRETYPPDRVTVCEPCKAGKHEDCKRRWLIHGDYGNFIRCGCQEHAAALMQNGGKG